MSDVAIFHQKYFQPELHHPGRTGIVLIFLYVVALVAAQSALLLRHGSAPELLIIVLLLQLFIALMHLTSPHVNIPIKLKVLVKHAILY